MATPGKISHAREIIKATELIEMLQINALDSNAEPLHQNKLHAIKILLAKAIPDLKAVEHTGDVDHDIRITWQK